MPDLRRLKTALGHVGRTGELLSCARQMTGAWTLGSAYVGLRPLPLPCTVRTRSGLQFRLDEFYDLETLWQVFCRVVYDVEPTDRVIVDAGANIGLFACYAAAVAPRAIVHAIEPFPATYGRLTQTVAANGLAARVCCHAVALSSHLGTAGMSGTGSPSQMFHVIDADRPDAVPVPAVTLEHFVREEGLTAIDLLKMDIEGSEYDVLLNTPPEVLRRCRRISVEYHRPPTGVDKWALARRLEEAGFRGPAPSAATGDYGIWHFRGPDSHDVP
jgi:FkbM family methyltransferase